MTAPLGVTIVTPGYEALAEEAIRRFKAATDCEAVLRIEVPEGQGFNAKLHLDELCPARPIVFFDADLWMLREFDVGLLMPQNDEWIAVHDPAVWDLDSWPARDCAAQEMEPGAYINTGLFGCDLSKHFAREVFASARVLASAQTMIDPTDQGLINLALQRLQVSVTMLPSVFNFYPLSVAWGTFPFTPRGVVGVHAAGFPMQDKLEALKAFALTLGGEHQPMKPGAMAVHHAATFELR